MSLIGESVMLSILERGENAAVTKAAVFFLFLFLAFYACFMSVITRFTAKTVLWPLLTCASDATTFIYAAELWPTPVRARGIALSTSALFLSSLAILEGSVRQPLAVVVLTDLLQCPDWIC
jgi:hypothetical protein